MTTWARRLLVVLGALGLTLAATWPLARCLGTCLGRPPDTLVSLYFLHWVAHALTTRGVPLLEAPMFAPYSGTLALGEYTPAYAPLAIPAIALTGNPVVAHNVVLLVLYTLAALGTMALGARLLGATGPAVVAGLAFAYSPRLLDQAYNLQTLSVAFAPWLFLVLERFLAAPTWGRAALVAGITLALALSSMNMLVFAGIAMAAFLLGAAALRVRPFGRGHLVRLVGVGVVATGLLGLYVAPYRQAAREWGLARSLAEVERQAPTLGALVRLPPEPLLRTALGVGTRPPADGLVLGLTVLALALVGVAHLGGGKGERRRAALAPYGAVAGVALVLALGPTLRTPWGAIPLPYRALYHAVPGFDAIRTPGRLLFFVDLGVALLAGAGVAAMLDRQRGARRHLTLVAVAGLILAESVLVPFPGAVPRLDPRALPSVYRWLATEPPRTVALGIPMGDWANVAAVAFHLRRTVNGWASFEPPRYAELVQAMDAFPDPRTLALVRAARADVVLVDRAWLTPARLAGLNGADSGFRLWREFDTHLVYRPTAPLPGGVEALEARATREPETAGAPPRLCVSLRNPGPGWAPLYPVRVVRLEAVGGGPPLATAGMLPLDLAPGGQAAVCLTAGAGAERGPIRGEIRGSDGAVHHFIASPDGLPRPLAAGPLPGSAP